MNMDGKISENKGMFDMVERGMEKPWCDEHFYTARAIVIVISA